MNTSRILNSVLILLIVAVLGGCTSEASRRRAERVEEAINAIRKIDAAVQVGIDNQQYRVLVAEAKAKVDLANDLLPDGVLKAQLNATLENYLDAGKAWAEELDDRTLLEPNDPVGQTLIDKYSLTLIHKSVADSYYGTVTHTGATFDEARHQIWTTGKQNLERLVALQPK